MKGILKQYFSVIGFLAVFFRIKISEFRSKRVNLAFETTVKPGFYGK